MAGHLQEQPDLTMLPEEERAPVQRALAKQPKKRWPCCKDFAAALRACADLEDLRDQVRADPMNAPLRRLYLALRTPELKEWDRSSARLRIHWRTSDFLCVMILGSLLYRGPYQPGGGQDTAHLLWWAVMLAAVIVALVGNFVRAWRLRRKLGDVLAELGPLGPSLQPALLVLPLGQLRKIYLFDAESPPP